MTIGLLYDPKKRSLPDGDPNPRQLNKDYRGLNCVLILDQNERETVIAAFRSGAVGICERAQS